LVKWHKKVGDKVEIGDVVADVETDKATMEMEAFDEGTIHRILIAEGSKVGIGEKLALLLEEDEEPPREPPRRHRDASELRDELLLLRGGRSVRQLRARERRKRFLLRATIVVLVMGVVSVGVMAALRTRSREAQDRRRESESQQVALLLSRARDILNDDAPAKRSRALATLREAVALRAAQPELRELVASALLVPELASEKTPWRPPSRLDGAQPRRWPVGSTSHTLGIFDPELRHLFRVGTDGWIEGIPIRDGARAPSLPPTVPGLNLEFISSVSPDGRWLLLANMPGNSLIVFKIDGQTGALTTHGDPISLPMPSCIRWME
jgi:type II secretory pathway pseudopilin PulG